MKLRLHWGLAVALVYTAFAAATVGFVVFAVAHPAALVSDDYYQQALRHDQRIAATANARAVAASLQVGREASGALVATLHLPAAHHGRSTGHITWYRPSDATSDRQIPLDVDGDGNQRLPLTGVAAGRWRVQVAWEVDGQPYHFEQVVTVTP
ncbi:MAG: hypothetical protein ABS36_15035 [Acidobacteria bacterium SCN 69-37]|nr:MAG: hypothetical protein ABS36_15035 [Acidobacteria bacterium SCN 69-37]